MTGWLGEQPEVKVTLQDRGEYESILTDRYLGIGKPGFLFCSTTKGVHTISNKWVTVRKYWFYSIFFLNGSLKK